MDTSKIRSACKLSSIIWFSIYCAEPTVSIVSVVWICAIMVLFFFITWPSPPLAPIAFNVFNFHWHGRYFPVLTEAELAAPFFPGALYVKRMLVGLPSSSRWIRFMSLQASLARSKAELNCWTRAERDGS